MGIRVTQIRSSIGVIPRHRGTLRALGLRGIGQTNVLPDRKEIRGMIQSVPYLIKVEENAAMEPSSPRVKRSSSNNVSNDVAGEAQ